MANPTPTVSNLLVLEEAHHLLSNPRTDANFGTTAQEEAIRALVTMLRTAGGTGVGIMILDQLPTKLVDEVVKLPVNVIIHALNDEEEYQLVGKHARCDAAQIDHIAGMQTGETVVFLASKGVPMNVKIALVESFLKKPLPDIAISDSIVRRNMKEILAPSPSLIEHIPIPSDIIEQLENEIEQLSAPTRVRPEQMADHKLTMDEVVQALAQDVRYIALCRKQMEVAQLGEPQPLASLMAGVVREFVKDGHDLVELAQQTHVHTMHAIGTPVDTDTSREVFTRLKAELGI